LVTIDAFLEDRHTSGGELQLDLISGRSRFTAHMEAPGSGHAFPGFRPGALLRLTGVSAPTGGQNLAGALVPSLWLRNERDISLVRAAPWWDLRRAVYAASTASLLLIVVLVWVVRLRHNLVVEMARRSSLEEQLLHAQKLESVGRLAGGVAHDFNNYLTVVLGYTSLLLDQFPENGLIRSQLNTIREVGEKTASLTRQLLAFSRKQVMQPVPSDLNEIISNAKSTLLPLIGEHIEIVMNLGPVEHANIDPAQFMQVLVNLAVNARDAMPKGGTLIFETMNMQLGPRDVKPEYGLQPGKYACVTISDTGQGMDRATRERIFEPFFTTKEAGRGTGLGLAVVFGIVKQSKGHIQVQSRPGFGTRFRIYLPTAERPTPAAEEPVVLPRKRLGSETILVVEDQTAVRQLVSTALQKHGYRVISAPGPMQALSILENTSVSIELVLTDLVMPEMSGHLLAAEAAVKRPGIRVLYMSGHSEEILSSRDSAGERIDCLEKPFTADEVAAAVRHVLDGVAVS
jgi:signal transduction histidine kinase/CheY-like chemotaxis protein